MASNLNGWDLNNPTVPAANQPPKAEAQKIIYVPVEKAPRVTAFNVIGLILFSLVLLGWLVPKIGILFPLLLVGLLAFGLIDSMRKRSAVTPSNAVPQGYRAVNEVSESPAHQTAVLALKIIAFTGIAIVLAPFMFFAFIMLVFSLNGGGRMS